MNVVNFTQQELDEIAQICAHLQITECTPPYLQDFIALRLDPNQPALSVKVRRLSPAEMDELCEYLRGLPSAA